MDFVEPHRAKMAIAVTVTCMPVMAIGCVAPGTDTTSPALPARGAVTQAVIALETSSVPPPTPWLQVVTPEPGAILPDGPLVTADGTRAYVAERLAAAGFTPEKLIVRRVRMSDFKLLTAGPGATWPTLRPGEVPSAFHPDSPMGQQSNWVVGLRLNHLTTADLVGQALGMPNLGDAMRPAGKPQELEFYVVLDELGNAGEFASLGSVDDSGRSAPSFLFGLQDIEALPATP
jgi:hypothetical protein